MCFSQKQGVGQGVGQGCEILRLDTKQGVGRAASPGVGQGLGQGVELSRAYPSLAAQLELSRA